MIHRLKLYAQTLAAIDERSYSDAELLREAIKSIDEKDVQEKAAAQLKRVERVSVSRLQGGT